MKKTFVWLFLFLQLFWMIPTFFHAMENEGNESILYYYAMENTETGSVVRRGNTTSTSIPRGQLILSPNSFYRFWVLDTDSGLIASSDFETSFSGTSYTIPDLFFDTPNISDGDFDGLTDDSEHIIGTNPNLSDSDGDGISDGSEIKQGLDPLDGKPARIGVLSSVDLPGTVMDVSAFNDLLIVAHSEGVSLFNVFNRMNPTLLGQVNTEGNAQRVAFSGNWLAVADGGGGLAIIDIRDPTQAKFHHQFTAAVLGGSAQAVATSGGMAYVGLSSGKLVSVDMKSGSIQERIVTENSIHDLGIEKDTLFVLSHTQLQAYSFLLELKGSIAVSAKQPEGITGFKRLFVGGDEAYVTSYPGYEVIDLTDPLSMLTKGALTPLGPRSFKQIVLNGSGLGIAAVGLNQVIDGTHHLSLYNVENPTITNDFLTTIQTPGIARAISLFNGLAYVAGHDKGLQVVNYLAHDTFGIPPTISLESSFLLLEKTNDDDSDDDSLEEREGRAEEGKPVWIRASVSDDVQVRNVEFYKDGNKVATDGNFPFEYRFVTPLMEEQLSFTLKAIASDTGGNITSSEEIVVTLTPDATPPKITHFTPRKGAILGRIGSVSVFFNEPMDPGSITPTSFQVFEAGADERLGTSDDVEIKNGILEWREDPMAAFLNFEEGLLPGRYQVKIDSSVKDLAGNHLISGEIWVFRVYDIKNDRDGDGVPDAMELLLGLDPDNPDSDGDGIFDGEEDFDNDGLTNMEEAVLGTDPQNPDTNGDGVKDGDEDSDGDGLRDIEELLIYGTDPDDHDSDQDGFNDGEEVAFSSDPLDPNSIPLSNITSSIGGTISVFNEMDPSKKSGVLVGETLSIQNNAPPELILGKTQGHIFSVENR